MVDGRPADLLATVDGVEAWLRVVGIEGATAGAAQEPLVEARAAIRAVVSAGDPASASDRLNSVLARGRLRLSLGPDGRSQRVVEVDDPPWRPAVLAAYDLLSLLDARPERIRRCDHPNCVLWFLDTSRNGTRRWCSMATCGNRSKVQRHYSRSRQA